MQRSRRSTDVCRRSPLVVGLFEGGLSMIAVSPARHETAPLIGNLNACVANRATWRRTLAQLVAMSEEELASQDIARLNLFCAGGLPRIQGVNKDFGAKLKPLLCKKCLIILGGCNLGNATGLGPALAAATGCTVVAPGGYRYGRFLPNSILGGGNCRVGATDDKGKKYCQNNPNKKCPDSADETWYPSYPK
jgi:hypothetical protein